MVDIFFKKSERKKDKYFLNLHDDVIDSSFFLSLMEVIELAKKLEELGF